MTRHTWLRLLLVSAMVCLIADSSIAQLLPFPVPPTTAADAADQFDARAMAVIHVTACRREDDFLQFRAQMAADTFEDDEDDFGKGEDLGHILVAKFAYLRAHNDAPCAGEIFRPHDPDSETTLQDFAKADGLARAAGPMGCALKTSEVLQVGQKDQNGNITTPEGVVVNYVLSRQCLAIQINQTIQQMKRNGAQLGTDELPCVETGKFKFGRRGDFDVTVRELVRILYLNGAVGREKGILTPETIDYMHHELLSARGALSDDSYSLLGGCTEPAGDELGSPEDTADRHSWSRELADSLGDVFGWLVGLPWGGDALSELNNLSGVAFWVLGDPGVEFPRFDFRVPESENHRLMIETSRYLTNAAIIAHLENRDYDHVEEIREDQDGVRDWLLQRLQDIAANDFQEYNSRPYTRYSLNAVLNLRDFAFVQGDARLSTAANIVLDLSAAKFAATSNRGRRVVSFRRLNDADGDGTSYLYESISGADHEVTRGMFLSGQTQLLDTLRDHGVEMGTLAEMVNAATSSYRLPAPVLATAVERRSMLQTVRHTGLERVFQSPAYTISAGGIRTGPTTPILGMGRDEDRGIAMPTVIIPTMAGALMMDLFRFEGIGTHHERTDNTCVATGFACGLGPKISEAFKGCTEWRVQDGQFFVSSWMCFPGSPGPHFYLAGRATDCSGRNCSPEATPRGQQWGLMDIVEAMPPPLLDLPFIGKVPVPDLAFARFTAERSGALTRANIDRNGHGTYVSAAGQRIEFSVGEGHSSIRTIDGVAPSPWVTEGDAIDADGLGRATLKGPGGPVVIDFSNWSAPKRTP
jgi:hypothetical protein